MNENVNPTPLLYDRCHGSRYFVVVAYVYWQHQRLGPKGPGLLCHPSKLIDFEIAQSHACSFPCQLKGSYLPDSVGCPCNQGYLAGKTHRNPPACLFATPS